MKIGVPIGAADEIVVVSIGSNAEAGRVISLETLSYVSAKR
jgi:hypothetical protein